MNHKNLFRMPKPMRITGRSSSITNAFVNSIIPVVDPSSDEVKNALEILGMDYESYCCAYCGNTASEWDHLRPLVVNKRPTGYISEIANLVPSCGKCNQSKGNKSWADWMLSDAKLSPTTRKVADLRIRMERLQAYENFSTPQCIDFESLVGRELWEKHWDNCDKVQEAMKEAQVIADDLKRIMLEGRHRVTDI